MSGRSASPKHANVASSVGGIRDGLKLTVPVTVAANLMLVTAEGKISQFVRSGFKQLPTEHWLDHWSLLTAQMFD
mgnify:CR=1 FL=1